MPAVLPPADQEWERKRPVRLITVTIVSYLLVMATLWIQTHDPEIVAASLDPELGVALNPQPTVGTAVGVGLLYAVPLLLWVKNIPYVLHLMAALCILGAVVFTLSAGTGFLWNWRVGVVPLAGVVVNLTWLLLAYRRDHI
ncbi:hypothetical protein [Kocuria sp.]|uniref:hypothetical protein n=1 Tax=Kocuria sp. TaxID=1871328 RepID=UPI0026E0BF84|nr:hypothetical protein [Kocuria sp.]